MATSQPTVEQVLTMLESTPARIAEATADVAPDQLQTAPGIDEWSANQVFVHLRSCVDVWGGCIVTILKEDGPTLRAVNPTTWIKQTDYPTLDFARSLRCFEAQRADLLALLRPLPEEDWSRRATVTGAGRVLERPVLSYAGRMATHERPHVKQIERIVRAAPGLRRYPGGRGDKKKGRGYYATTEPVVLLIGSTTNV